MDNLDHQSAHFISVTRINAVIDFIEQNLEKELSLKVLAKLACYSNFHFHRIFTSICKETPHEFVRRKRIEKIAWLILKQKNVPIKKFAFQYGFENASSFSRAFKKYYGTSAKEFRMQSKSVFNTFKRQNSKIGKGKVSVEDYFCNVEKIRAWISSNAQISTRFLEDQTMFHIRSQGSFDLSNNAFEKLRQWAETKNLLQRKNRKWALIIHDNPALTEASKISHSACLRINKEGATEGGPGILTIPKGRFLIGRVNIRDSEFKAAWGGMGVWMLDNGFSYRDGYYFELFHSDSLFQEGAKHTVDLCIPIA